MPVSHGADDDMLKIRAEPMARAIMRRVSAEYKRDMTVTR